MRANIKIFVFGYRDGEKNSLSFLINMETLFQDFVASLLKMEFGEANVVLQKAEYMDIWALLLIWQISLS